MKEDLFSHDERTLIRAEIRDAITKFRESFEGGFEQDCEKNHKIVKMGLENVIEKMFRNFLIRIVLVVVGVVFTMNTATIAVLYWMLKQ